MNAKKHIVSPLGALLALTIGVAALIAGAGAPGHLKADASNGTFQFSLGAYSVTEGQSAVLTITRTGGTAGAVNVNYTVGVPGDTATGGGVDYSVSAGTVSFSNMEGSRQLLIPTVNDSAPESPETFTVTITNAAPGLVGGTNNTAVVTIQDNDAAGISVAPTSGLVTSESGAQATFAVQLNTQPTANVTIGLTSSNLAEGTVSPPSLTFTTGNWSTPQTVTVTGVNDLSVDGNIPYTIITAPATSTDGNYNNLNAADVSVTNLDNDGAGQFQFASGTYSVSEAGVSVTLFVNRINGSAGTVTVDYATSSGTATSGADFTATAATLTFGAGVTQMPITVTILQDLLVEGAETFNVTLSNGSAGTSIVGTNPSVVTIVDDDTTGAPVVTSVSPNFGPISGLAGVTITGVNLSGALSVTFGGSSYPATITFNSSTTIIANAPAHFAATVDVQVTTASGTSATSVADQFTYGGVAGLPVVYNVNPTSGPTAGMTYFTITGTNFTGVNVSGGITFGGTAVTSFTVVSNTTITGYTPAHVAGLVQVRVANAVGTSLDNGTADDFIYGAVTGLPTVTSVTPVSGPTTGLTYFTLTGTNFTGVNIFGGIAFGGTAVTSFTVVSDSTITGYTPAHVAGLVQVRVTNAVGTSLDNGTADDFTYTGTSPMVGSVSPSTGPVGGGTTVVITGSGFTGATSVSFGGTAAGSFAVNTDSQITVTSPAHTAGTVNVFVTVGAVTSPEAGTADNFTYTSTGAHSTYTLSFRWNLIVWFGADGAGAENALKGFESPDDTLTNNVFSIVTAVFSWSAGGQRWLAFYPSGVGVAGANDFTTLTRYGAYWVAVTTTTNWTIATP